MAVTRSMSRIFLGPPIFRQAQCFCPLLPSCHQSQSRRYRKSPATCSRIADAAQLLKKNFGLLFREVRDHLRGPGGRPMEEVLAEQTHVLWEFRDPGDLERWTASSDAEIGGKSRAFMKMGATNQSAVFYGVLNSEVPRDGEKTSSGYCTFRSKPPQGAFGRKLSYDWSIFNMVHLRVRGDGRPWMVNLQHETYYQHNWDDLYHFFFYTRGGPYWQDVKIPISKFILSYRGRVQDGQHPLLLDKMKTLGFTLADRADGPFQLEVDFIGLCKDAAHTEEFAYELYKNVPM